MKKSALYAYCVVASAGTPETDAPEGMPEASALRALGIGRHQWLLVADVPAERYGERALEAGLQDLDWVSANAVAHERVVESFLGADALLPMKLFTLFESEDSALAAMRSTAKRTRSLLRRLAGKVEHGVRVRFLAAPAPPAPSASSTNSGRAFLEGKKQARDTQRTAVTAARAAAKKLAAELAAAAVESKALPAPPTSSGSGLLLDSAFLLDRDRVPAFEAILGRHGATLQGLGCEIVLTGPWPAYHFLDAQ